MPRPGGYWPPLRDPDGRDGGVNRRAGTNFDDDGSLVGLKLLEVSDCKSMESSFAVFENSSTSRRGADWRCSTDDGIDSPADLVDSSDGLPVA